MIYLISGYLEDFNNNPIKCLKIGYTENLELRLRDYKTMNPGIKLIKSREGDREMETFLHNYFHRFLYPGQREWFIYSKKIIDKFDKIEISSLLSPANKLLKKYENFYETHDRVNSKELKRSLIKFTCDEILSKIKYTIKGKNEEFVNSLIGRNALLYIKTLGIEKVKELDYNWENIKKEYQKLYPKRKENFITKETKIEPEETNPIKVQKENSNLNSKNNDTKIYFLKTAGLIKTNECIPVFTLITEEQVTEISKSLISYQVIGERELSDISVIGLDIFKNYEQLYLGQPEIIKEYLETEQGIKWFLWNKEAEDIFFDIKPIDQQIIEFNGDAWLNEKDKCLRKLIAELSIKGGDNSGSLLNEFLLKSEKDPGFWEMRKMILENDWRLIFENSELLKYLCPDVNDFFQSIINTFGSLNTVFEKSGEVTEYIPKSDRYNYKELKALRDSLVTKKQLREQLRDVCEFMMKPGNEIYPRIDMPWLPEFIKEALGILEPERLKALGYNKSDIIEEIKLIKSHSLIKDRLARKLKPGERYTREFLKNLIKNIFTELKLPGTSKPATYIQNFFNVEECRMWLRDEDGNRKKYWAYRIISMKES